MGRAQNERTVHATSESEMSNSPNSNPPPESNSNRRLWLLLLTRTGIALGLILLAGIVGGALWAWRFVDKQLAPFVGEQLSRTFDRPVNVGNLERFSLTSLRFGRTTIPPTATDSDRASVQAVDVQFNPWTVVWSRELNLDITLVDPDVYLEQTPDGAWVNTRLAQQEGEPVIKVNLNTIETDNATVVLAPQPSSVVIPPPANAEDSDPQTPPTQPAQPLPVTFEDVGATAEFLDGGDRIKFNAKGDAAGEGYFSASGEYLVEDAAIKLNLRGRNLQAAQASRLLNQIPLQLNAGELNANIQLQHEFGGASELPRLGGNVSFEAVTARISQVPQPITAANGRVRFKDFLIGLENVGANYGQIPIKIPQGLLHLQRGYEIPIQVPPAPVSQFIDTLAIASPVEIEGEAKAALKIVGELETPVLVGQAAITQPTTIDRVPFQTASAKFAFATEQMQIEIADIKATPTTGGQIEGRAKIQLQPEENPPIVVAEYTAQNLNGDAIAGFYNAGVPQNIAIGAIDAKGRTAGTTEQLQTQILWQANAGTYPAQGEVQVVGDATQIRGIAQVDGGRVRADVGVKGDRWEAALVGSGIPLQPFVPATATQGLTLGRATGQVKLAGTVGETSPATLVAAGQGQLTVEGGAVEVQGQLARGQWQANVRAQGVGVEPLLPPGQVRTLSVGGVTGQAKLAGNLAATDLSDIQIAFQGSLPVEGGTVQAGGQVARGRWQADVRAQGVGIESLLPPAQARTLSVGSLTGRARLAGNLAATDLSEVQVAFQGSLPVEGGTVQAGGKVEQGQWEAEVVANDIQLDRLLSPQQTQGLAFQPISGRAKLAGSVASFAPDAIVAAGQGRLNVEGGAVAIKGQLAQGNWDLFVEAEGVGVDPLLPPGRLDAVSVGAITGKARATGNLATLNLGGIEAAFQGSLPVDSGAIEAAGQLSQGRWQGEATARNLPLGAFLPPQQLAGLEVGAANGKVKATGSVFAFDPDNVEAAAQLQVLLDGQTVQAGGQLVEGKWEAAIANATIPLAPLVPSDRIRSLTSNTFSVEVGGQLGIEQLKLVGTLAAFSPEALRQAVQPGNLEAAGQIQLRDLRLSGSDADEQDEIVFESVLSGGVRVAEEGIGLQLKGDEDEIALRLDSNYQPLAFRVAFDDTQLAGQSEGELFQIAAQNFPLSPFNVRPPGNFGTIAGEVSANVSLDLQPLVAAGTVRLDNPEIGTLQAQNAIATFRYAGDSVTVNNALLCKILDPDLAKNINWNDANSASTCAQLNPNASSDLHWSQYGFRGQAQLGEDLAFSGQTRVRKGRIQDVLLALRWFEIEDIARGFATPEYADASAIDPVPVGMKDEPLLTQLRRFSEIQALLRDRERRRQEAQVLPDLRELDGIFEGVATTSGSLAKGIQARFDFNAQTGEWGSFDPAQIVVKGDFKDDTVNLLPLEVRLGDALASFSGQIGGENQSGQFQLENLPVSLLTSFIELPPGIKVTGDLNGQASISGSLANPNARGTITLADGTLSRQPIQEARGSFSYADARLKFGSTIAIEGPDPIQVTGSLPYRLPVAEVYPDSDEIDLNVSVRNQGLAVLNLLTNSVSWQGGQGQVELNVSGTLFQPIASGVATFENATLNSPNLPEPLTDATGRIEFDRDRVVVKAFQGNFRQGQVEAAGVVPIFYPLSPDDPDAENPLTVNLDRVALNLRGLYNGGINGQVQISGSALFNPQIGGTIELSDGQVLIASDPAATAPASTQAEFGPVIEYNDLTILLGEDVRVVSPPIMEFIATGDLTLNGTLDVARPQGTIRLLQGQVNIFTTQFSLLRGYEHTATFSPERGLNPYIDVRMVASVQEATGGSRIPSASEFPGEVDVSQESAFRQGSIQTIRVIAEVEGLANEILSKEALELSSSPARSEAEIVALLGGGFVNTLGRGDSTLAIANLAGSAVLTRVETAIGRALGLSEFRLFPTINNRTSSLGLAAEAGIDITGNFSASVLRVLTEEDTTQFGIRYRLNDNILFRGSTDFSDENQGVVEYELRF